MRVAVVGLGAVGVRAARQLLTGVGAPEVQVHDVTPGRSMEIASALASGTIGSSSPFPDVAADRIDVVVLATPSPQHELAAAALSGGAHVVATSDDVADVQSLLDLGPMAEAAGRAVLVGAGFAPGLTCLLARFVAREFDTVDEIHVAKHGTGGPACARQHHRALASTAAVWRDGRWVDRPGGSGRELAWFPDPIGARDCYNAQLPDALLLLPAFPDAQRLSSRTSATRRDRLTSRLPMLRRPHPEGGLGAIRVEVRGTRGRERAVEVLGAVDRPGVAAGGVAAVVAGLAPVAPTGAYGLADPRLDTEGLLAELASRGIRAARFVGLGATPG
jgi:hypothetical protein